MTLFYNINYETNTLAMMGYNVIGNKLAVLVNVKTIIVKESTIIHTEDKYVRDAEILSSVSFHMDILPGGLPVCLLHFVVFILQK